LFLNERLTTDTPLQTPDWQVIGGVQSEFAAQVLGLLQTPDWQVIGDVQSVFALQSLGLLNLHHATVQPSFFALHLTKSIINPIKIATTTKIMILIIQCDLGGAGFI